MNIESLRRPSRRTLLKRTAALTAFASGFGAPLVGSAETLLRVSFPVPANDPATLECMKFVRLVEQRSNGALRLETFFSGTLLKEPDVLAGMQNGVVDVALLSTSWLEPPFPRLQALNIPFIFPSHASMWRVLDGDIGRGLDTEMTQKGAVPLAWGAYAVRQFEFREKRVAKPEDMRGLRIRIINSAIFVSMMKALGAVPVAIESTETLLALQQKTVDGLDIPLASLISTKMFQTVKYVTLTDHGMSSAALLMSKPKLDSLPAPQQKIVLDAAKEMASSWRAATDNWNDTAVAELIKQGITVDKVDKAPFSRAMAPVYDEFRKKLGADYIDRIIRVASA